MLLVFHLEPLIRAASTARRAKPLGQPLFELLQAKYPNQLSGHQPIFVVPISTPRGYIIGLLSVHLRRRKRRQRCSGLKAAGADCIIQKH